MQLIQMQKPINRISYNQISFKWVPQISRGLWKHYQSEMEQVKCVVPAQEIFHYFFQAQIQLHNIMQLTKYVRDALITPFSFTRMLYVGMYHKWGTLEKDIKKPRVVLESYRLVLECLLKLAVGSLVN